MSKQISNPAKGSDLTQAPQEVPLRAVFLGKENVGFDADAVLGITGAEMTIRFTDPWSSERLNLRGRPYGSGYETPQSEGRKTIASWALLGDVWVGHMRRAEGEYLFYFRSAGSSQHLHARIPDFEAAGAVALDREVPAKVWVCGVDRASEFGAAFRATFVRRAGSMVIEIPEQTGSELYEFVGDLLDVGYLAGTNQTGPGAQIIARWAPVRGGFIGLWRELGEEYYFYLRPESGRAEEPAEIPSAALPKAKRVRASAEALHRVVQEPAERSSEAMIHFLHEDGTWESLAARVRQRGELFGLEILEQADSLAYTFEAPRVGSDCSGTGRRSDGAQISVTAHLSEGGVAGLWVEEGFGYPFFVEEIPPYRVLAKSKVGRK